MSEAKMVSAASPAMSVVMPVRNGAAYLGAAVQSVLVQTFADFEFIIVDDGSSDRTPAILSAFAASDDRVRLLRTSGEGIVAALNLGIGTARGLLIARMDADDIALPERFATQTAALRAMPTLVAIGSEAITIDPQGNETGRMTVPADASTAMAELSRHNSFLHPTMMLRRDAMVLAGLYRPACIYAEDYDLWLRISERGEMANIAEPLIKFRVHSQQTSKVKRFTQRAATALARQLSVRRRKGQEEGIDMSLPLRFALAVFLRQRAEGGEVIERSEAKDIEIILREVHSEIEAVLVEKLIRLLRSRQSLGSSLFLRLKLGLARRRSRE